KREGDRPSDPPDPLLVKRRLLLDFEPEEFADLMEAVDQMRRVIGPRATTAQAIAAMAKGVLGKSHNPELPAHQIAVTRCAGCDRTRRPAGGEAIEVPDAIGASAKCDGEVAGITEIEPAPTESSHVGQSNDGGPECIEAIVERRGIRGLLRATTRA